MLNKNSFINGLILGIVVPAIGFGIVWGIFALLDAVGLMSEVGFRPYFRERTTSIVAIAFNAILMNRFQKRRMTDSMRGVVIPTFVFIVVWIILFWDTIFPGEVQTF